ncbi:barstar family protein [Streptomyces sp. HU2014]|uniref:barstar family protein n=1 Tax=Streptomyces sp. HU2014 TaxID=2939414 RepID=UPI00200CB030|nr:barstar family protein [Streptomyces sp. HU2014]UQI43739.1 barstar family protein [Streptomyces sp. HU2014]
MTDALDLWSTEGAWLHVQTRDVTAMAVDLVPPPGITFTGRLDGARMGDSDGVFEQFWNQFRFPDYFGWNWPALSDCLRDLQWIKADRYLVVIENAGSVLDGTPDDWETFLGTLHRASAHWANPHEKPAGVGIPFNVLLVCDPEEVAEVRERVSVMVADV